MLYNVLPNAARLAENDALLLDFGRLVDALPPHLRVTPLEAYHNSLSHVPVSIGSSAVLGPSAGVFSGAKIATGKAVGSGELVMVF